MYKINTKKGDNKKMCEHEFDGKDRIETNNGIVFVVYKCKKCNEEFDQCIGETWKPNEDGVFDY